MSYPDNSNSPFRLAEIKNPEIEKFDEKLKTKVHLSQYTDFNSGCIRNTSQSRKSRCLTSIRKKIIGSEL
ncbi:hypothetical protein AYI69_g7900 [Smittium culicis]|uniref:Uncharacterized protein n=1 Tax=Smittium culicis TaxID=133412 RepID=A0A1R1XNN3_9FUNG|nr:hypothetical protein AYI69_g7900 [Smittium culicis]